MSQLEIATGRTRRRLPFVGRPHAGPILALVMFTASAVLATSSAALARPAPDSFADVAERVLPAVVNISTVQKAEVRFMSNEDHAPGQGRPGMMPPGSQFEEFFERFFGDRRPDSRPPHGPNGAMPEARALGSGFVVDADGFVVTNNHVVANAEEIEVTLGSGKRHKAKLVGADTKTDLALLKIEAEDPLPYVSFGDSDGVRVGDWVMAVGNPFGLGGSVTAGIVSARGRDLQGGTIVDFLQIDAPINRGSSGGPTFDGDGKIIGVNTAIFSPNGGNVGIGFAVPSNIAKRVIGDLREHGAVTRGWLGVRIQPVTEDLAEGFGLDEARGALITSVEPKSPAAEAGIRSGDVVTQWKGQDVRSPSHLARLVAKSAVDQKTEVTVWRDGAKKAVTVTVMKAPGTVERAAADEGARPPAESARHVPAGLFVADLTPDLRRQHGLAKDVAGVLVTGVKPGSVAARQGLRRGDVITSVSLKPVDSVDALSRALKQGRTSEKQVVTLKVSRQGRERFVALRMARA